LPKILQTQTVSTEKLLETLSYTRDVYKMLAELNPTGGQFHQHSSSSYSPCRSQKHKKTDSSTVFFELSGSAFVKGAGRTLMKLTLSDGFSNGKVGEV